MPETHRPWLDRSIILDAAIEISRSGDQPAKPVTGATLGSRLGVDRSALWRHFADKQDLLNALNDRLLLPIVEEAASATDPVARLSTVFRCFIDVYTRHPLLAQELLGTSPLGENWRRLAEVVVTALGDYGLSAPASAGYFRLFIEVTTSYATSLAASENRPAAKRERETAAAQLDLMNIDAERFPHLAETAPHLWATTETQIAEGVFRSLTATLESSLSPRQDPTSR